jgi:type VI secretion system protein ImpM
MSHPHFCLPETREPPGWYGKLPGMGDFAQRRLPNRFVSVWDKWLQNGFEYLRSADTDWAKSYLQGHVWFFMLGPSVIGPKPWIGLLIPSVDSVGRYFPITIARELIEGDSGDDGTDTACTDPYVEKILGAYAQATLAAIELDLGAEEFDHQLAQSCLEAASLAVHVSSPKAARSIWHTNANFQGHAGFSIGGMPGNSEFSLLFSSADDATRALTALAQ